MCITQFKHYQLLIIFGLIILDIRTPAKVINLCNTPTSLLRPIVRRPKRLLPKSNCHKFKHLLMKYPICYLHEYASPNSCDANFSDSY